jgi:hypothetical protein
MAIEYTPEDVANFHEDMRRIATTSLTAAMTRTLPVGTKVYCTVHGCLGWTTITAVRPRDGYIKIAGERVWCPPHNFTLGGPR